MLDGLSSNMFDQGQLYPQPIKTWYPDTAYGSLLSYNITAVAVVIVKESYGRSKLKWLTRETYWVGDLSSITFNEAQL